MIRKAVILAVSGLFLGVGAAHAQDRSLEPAFGVEKLPFGFTPDPFVLEMLAGGDVDAFDALGGDCLGYIAEAPDFRILYTAGDAPLVIAATTDAGIDTTLVIAAPDGSWYCGDDTGASLDPQVIFEAPQSGQYDIWVGTFSEIVDDFPEATLTISEIAPVIAELDWSLAPNYGTVERVAGLDTDPITIDLAAGGDVDVTAMLSECRGFATSAPDLRMMFTPDGGPLVISVESDRDTTLIVSDPDANWICDDDTGDGVNPLLVIEDPLSGQYDIWVGTYSAGTAEATLTIGDAVGGTALNWDLTPNSGAIDLVTGFTPNPYLVGVIAGGDIDVSTIGDQCWGYATAAPDFRLFFEPGEAPLIFGVDSDIDTTLVIADPDGGWWCNDDTNGFNPEIAFDSPLSGQYDVWVATFSSGDSGAATLSISEPGAAAGMIDWSLDPLFGETDVAAGFLPDPIIADVTAGGPIAASSVDDSCRGSVTGAPAHRLYYEAGAFPLFIWVESEADTTLLISDPNGDWICDDDGGMQPFQPALGWDSPLSGQYDIWVGVFGGGTADATLFISETQDERETADGPDPVPPVADPDPAPPVADPGPDGPVFVELDDLDPSLPPLAESLSLSGGFSPDPTTVDLIAGGPISANDATGESCFGRVNAAADVHLDYTADAWPLILSVESEGDTTLVVLTPGGEWVCDDDSGEGLNPSITFDDPESGTYVIWIGTFFSDTEAATLNISEVSSR